MCAWKSLNPLENSTKDFALKLYEGLIKEIRALERNYIALLVPLITALGVYGVGLREFLYNNNEKGFIFFTVTTMAFIILLMIVWFSSNIFAYLHRSNQIVISRIEEKARLYENRILPEDWNLLKKLKDCGPTTDPPEVYKFFKLVSFFTGAMGIIIYAIVIELSCLNRVLSALPKLTKVHISLGIGILILMLVFLCARFRWCSFKDRLKEFLKVIQECYSNRIKNLAINYENCSMQKEAKQEDKSCQKIQSNP